MKNPGIGLILADAKHVMSKSSEIPHFFAPANEDKKVTWVDQ